MKVLIPLLFLCSLSFFSFSQPVHEQKKNLPKTISPLQLQRLQAAMAGLPSQTQTNARQMAAPCQDTASVRWISITNGKVGLESVAECMNGGLLVTLSMFDTSGTVPLYENSYGMLLKLDEDGNIQWMKQFEEMSPGISFMGRTRAFELQNQDIIFTATIDTSYSHEPNTIITRLTSNGALLWKNCLQSNISVFNSGVGTFTFWPEDATDGPNGDVILCGTNYSNLASGKLETVVRLNNQGQLIWDANYGNANDINDGIGAEGVRVFIENGQITFIGISHGSSYRSVPSAINFLRLNYTDGSLISKRFFRPDYTDPNLRHLKDFTDYYNTCSRLPNGHYIFCGRLMSSLSKTTPIIDHFGVAEFDQSFNLVNSYTISSNLTTGYYYNDVIHFDRLGKGFVTVYSYVATDDANLIFATFRDRQFIKQRITAYNNVEVDWLNLNFASFNDGGYAFLQNLNDQLTFKRGYIEFRKMYDSDTNTVCMGHDTTILKFLPLTVIEDPAYLYLNTNIPNKLVQVPLAMTQTDTTTAAFIKPCFQTSYCDTIKIHGVPTLCGSTSYLDFTSFKRNTCGAISQWSIDTNAIDSIKTTSDSSARVWFKNINWQGNLYASLPKSACYSAAIDSMAITIIKTQSQVDLGPDEELCTPNTLVLHAGNYFSTYQWQDGSTDSILTVTTPGKYWVEAHDQCGATVSDTINLLPFTGTISIGPDRIKCNTDTLRLNAPAGFLNYQWSNNYYLNILSPQSVTVNPVVDTAYYIKAEKRPGCFVYDTVRITVYTSPPIQLGTDTSFCTGQSLVLDAGAGFSNYLWNTASTNQQITVNSAGSYSVTGTAANGCRSYDTLRVLSVWPQPVIALNHNPDLCVGESRTLTPGNFNGYRWQDGSTGNSFVVTDTGKYFVTVQDAHACTASDTVQIMNKLPLPAAFLPADTAVCSYGKVELKPQGNYSSYLWSNGATAASITVKQAGLYWLYVTDSHHCSGTDSINVLPKECLIGFNIPNAFTPNHDGRNDTFKPIIGGIVLQYQFMIYNRWGQLLFASNELNQGWDGTAGGKPQDSNSFVWTCRFKLEGDEHERLERGTVTLIR